MDARTKRLLLVAASNLVNPVLALMWAIFAASTWITWSRTHSVVALLLFFVNTLFAALFVLRRGSVATSENPKDWMITAATILLSFSLRVVPESEIVRVAIARALQGVGVAIILFSLGNLGRSFGLIPANRGIKTHGLYAYVRHPLYTGEMLFYIGFMVGSFTLPNFAICLCILLGLNVRASAEERLLRRDEVYLKYLGRVHYRFFPGLY